MINRLSAALAAAVLAAGPALAQDGAFYARAFGGASGLMDTDLGVGGTTTALSFGGGTFAGAALGYDYAGPWRTEVEFAYRSGDAKGAGVSGDFASTTVAVNGIYSFETATKLRPYVGVGIGYVTEVDFDLTGTTTGEYSDRGLLAGQVIVGADYALSARWSAFGEVRAFAAKTPDLRDASGAAVHAKYRSLDLAVGLALRF